jgi:DNA polymerase III subunit beta
MKFEAQRTHLLEALTVAALATDNKGSLPILSSLIIEFTGDRMLVAGTNLRQSVECMVPGKGKPCRFAANAKGLADRIRSLEGETVTLTLKDAQLTVKAGSRRFTMHTLDGTDFPAINRAAGDEVHVDGSKLAALIASTQHSIENDPSRAHLNSLFLEFGEGITATATDGKTMTSRHVAHDGRAMTALVPLASIKPLRQICEKGGTVALISDGRHLSARRENTTVTTILTQDPFPPYRQILDFKVQQSISVSRERLRAVVGALQATGGETFVASDKSREAAPQVLLSGSGDRIAITSRNNDGEEADDCVECDAGDGWCIKLQSRFLMNALAGTDAEAVTLGISGELDPFMISDGAGYRAVIMPTRR